MNKKINLIINKTGFVFCLLAGIALFLSEKFENNIVIHVLLLAFVISMIFRENRKKFFENLDIEFSIELLLFVFVPFIIAYFDGGIDTRLDNYLLKYLIFFPFIFFIRSMKRIMIFLKATLAGAMIVMFLATYNFIKDYKAWATPVGSYYPRITAILTVQDFANIMCIVLLFLISFLLFYKNEDKKKNRIIKIVLAAITILTLFLVIVNRSKMVYICLLPTIFYIALKKRKRYILAVFLVCVGGDFLFPSSISERMQYIVNYEKDPSSKLRIIFWKTGMEAFRQKPVLGWKWEDRKEFNLDYYEKIGVSKYVHENFLDKLSEWPIYYVHTHNTYLQFLLDFGIVGILFFVIFFVSTFMKAVSINFSKNKENNDSKLVALEIGTKTALAAWAIQGITDINLNNKYMIIISVILLFLLNYLWREKIKLEKGQDENE